jgi:tetratricopeptide (TPR) repeat protein
MNIGETGRPNYGILTERFMSSRQWDRALAASLEWLGSDPENLQAHRAAAQSLINLDREAEAGPHLERVLAGNPNDDFSHRLMSLVHFEQGRFKAADESIRKAIELNPHDGYHWYHLARMSLSQGDLAAAKKWAGKARELLPRNPIVLNLLIMCEPNSPESAEHKIRQYEEALELDPESANIHNNIGAQYLDGLKDYAKAEECFRRALFFDPASKVYRKNLFITVKQRDLVYRALCAPKDFLFKVASFFSRLRKESMLLYILLIPIWLIAFRFVLGGLLLWCMFVWPLMKVYEYLTIGDLRARAGELGARRGGFLGYRKWPLKLRLSIFAFLLVSCWGGLAVVAIGNTFFRGGINSQAVFGTLLSIALVFSVGYVLQSKIRKGISARASRKRTRQMEDILAPKPEKRKWWQFLRRKPESP